MNGMTPGMGMLGSTQTGGVDPQALMQMMQTKQRDPFSRPLAGEGLMGPGNMALPQPPGLADTQVNNPQQGMSGPELPGMNTISTDFANTQPGLPNLPDSFLGFGFGQFAPKEVSTGPGGEGGMQGGMRQQMIMQMLQQLLPQLQQGGGQMGDMGAMGSNFGGPDMRGGFGGM